MDLSRQEYPALLTTLQPPQAVAVLNDRVQSIENLNQEIVSWLAERRAIEDAYIQGLRRLSGRRLNSAQLGVFQLPWQNVTGACDSLADAHSTLSQKINSDVEKPLREYSTRNREMASVKSVQGNMTSLAKDVEEARKRSDKIMSKGNKADSAKLSAALSSVQEAQQQWESQAPYVFEQLQALDEQRVNHLRDVLTQFQTHQSDMLERSRIIVASCLENLLNVDTNEEISAFVARVTNSAPGLTQAPQSTRRMSRHSTSSTSRPNVGGSSEAPPIPEIPRALTVPLRLGRRDSSVSAATESRDQSAVPEASTPKKSSISGLRRLGTVMRRNKDNKATPGPSSEKKGKPSRNPLKRGASNRNTMMPLGSPDHSMTELADTSSTHPSQTNERTATADSTTNGAISEPAAVTTAAVAGAVAEAGAATAEMGTGSPQANGSARQVESQEKPTETSPPIDEVKESERPPSTVDDITRAQQEAAAMSEGDQPQFQVNIRNEPIPEEADDAQKAISDTANILRQGAQPPPRRAGTARGRRDVRNTMFVPNNVAADLANLGDLPITSPPTDGVRTTALASLSPSAAGKTDDAQSTGDTQSIRSSRSLSSMAAETNRHPEMTAPGLNVSIVETVSATIENGQVTKATALGEMALAYHGHEGAPDSETLRLENFQVLEKVAPNPAFITPIEGKSGEYTLSLPRIGQAQIGFKYQVHLDDTNLAVYAPVLLTPMWKVEATQTSVILNYAFNPAFGSEKRAIALQNAVVMIGIANAKASACQSKPSGTFSKEKSMIYWRLGDVQLEDGSTGGKLLARFSTDTEAAPGTIEARWEIAGEHAVGVGSGLGLSIAGSGKDKEVNPFDEEEGAAATAAYQEVAVQRKLVSGKYIAV